MPLSDAELTRLLELEAKSTPGPWHGLNDSMEAGYFVGSEAGKIILLSEDDNDFDIDFAAAARNALRSLVEEVQQRRHDAEAWQRLQPRKDEIIDQLRQDNARLRSANAKLVEACEAAQYVLQREGFYESADKCRAAISAAKE